MNETAKTFTFVAVGAVALLSAYFINAGARPIEVEDRVGTSLNADVNIDDPKGLKIVKFDKATASTRQFEVAAIDGVWRIPSKQDYPADATQQMAAAANALIDRKILRVAAHTADAHAGLGVVDPLSATLDSSSEGVGTRVVMNDADENPIIDMIVGKKVKDAEGQRYVRMSNQDVVYIVELDADTLSTNFEDWIEDDLLKLSPFDVSQVFINDYSAELSLGLSPDGQIVRQVSWDRRGEATLDYNNEESKWQLADLKKFDEQNQEMVEDKLADDEEVNQEALNNLRTGLDELLIVDVAKKPEGLSGDLKAGADFLNNREAQADLMSKGFAPVPLKPGAPPEILSSEGELVCTQRDGVEYVLRFGRLQVQTDSAADGDDDPATADATSDAEALAKAEASGDEKNLRRYLFVMARFNEDAVEKPKLQELPAAPAETESPADESAAPAAEGAPAEASPAEEAAGDAAAAESATEAPGEPAEAPAETPPGGDQPEAAEQDEPTDDESPTPAVEETEAPAETEPVETPAADEAPKEAAPASAADPLAAAREAVEQENKRLQDEYQRTVEDGKKRVAELNERFGDWYYVISNDVYKQIHLSRGDIIKKKDPAAEAGAPAEANPLSGLPNLPGAPAE